MAVPFDTYDAYTQEFWDSKRVHDQVFVANPLLKMAERVMKADMLSDTISFPIQYDHHDATWMAKGAQITAAEVEIGTKAQFSPKFVVVKPKIDVVEIELNKGKSVQIANIFDQHISNAVDSLRAAMETAFLGPIAGSQPDSYYEASTDSATYGGIAVSDVATWKALIGEATYGTPSIPLAASLDNISRMIRGIEDISGEKPSWGMTSNAVWDVLHDQYVATYHTQPKPNVTWGFDELVVSGVPIYHSIHMSGSTFDDGEATRALCGGHEVMFINEKYTYPRVHATRNFSWDPAGWRKYEDYDLIYNWLWWWGTVVCTKRKANGHIFGIDPTLDPATWTQDNILDLSTAVAAYIPS